MNWRRIFAVLKFESVRSMTLGRIAGFMLLVFFGPILSALLRSVGELPKEEAAFYLFLLYMIIPIVTCVLGLLLWATPVMSTEIEGKTWLYVAVRPGGKAANLFGKYLSAVVWTWGAATISLMLALAVVNVQNVVRSGLTLAGLVVLSSLAYGALFTLFGVVFQKRAMVVAVFYTVLFEGIVSMVPAVINKMTVNYHLRGLLVIWSNMDLRDEQWLKVMMPDEVAWQHLLYLGLYIIVMLGVSYFFIHTREYVTADET